MKTILRMAMILMVMLCSSSVGAWAQTLEPMPFPFAEDKQLTPEQIKIQKYKMRRLRIAIEPKGWHIVKGISERISDDTLMRLAHQNERLAEFERQAMIGHAIGLGGILLTAGGGVLVSNVFKIENGIWYGIGAIVLGGAAAIIGETLAGAIGDENAHMISREDAEGYVKMYNTELKKELELQDVKDLE